MTQNCNVLYKSHFCLTSIVSSYGIFHYTIDLFQANIERLVWTYLEAIGTKVQSYPFKTLVTASLISLLSRDCPTDAVLPFGKSFSNVATPVVDVAVLPSFAVLDNISAIVI